MAITLSRYTTQQSIRVYVYVAQFHYNLIVFDVLAKLQEAYLWSAMHLTVILNNTSYSFHGGGKHFYICMAKILHFCNNMRHAILGLLHQIVFSFTEIILSCVRFSYST